jgi:ethanolamine kinase
MGEVLTSHQLVFAHCDLLSGNVIVLPSSSTGTSGIDSTSNGTNSAKSTTTASPEVTFIDYEYATPSPAAFDIANHFAEWGGFDCDFNVLPTQAQRRDFIREYATQYFGYQQASADVNIEAETEKLFAEVDMFRGIPGFYWGIWALIQATISQIDFNYADYAEIRLGEYFAWKAEADGSREKSGKEMPLRERRWAQEE